MDSVNMHQAKSRLSQLVDAVESGRETEIIIARNGKPAARLVSVAPKPDVSKRIGVAEGRFTVPENWDAYDEEIAALFNDGPIFPR